MKLSSAALLLLLAMLHSADATAQSTRSQHPLLTDTLTASVGAFILDRDFRVRVDGKREDPRTETDLVGAARLGSSDSTLALEARWRFGEKWSLWAQYFDTSEDGRAELAEDVAWEDVVFGRGTGVGAGVSLKLTRLFLGRLLSEGDRHEFGAGLGLHRLKLGAYVEGNAIIDGEDIGAYRGAVDASAPLPNIGAWYTYAFDPRWAVVTRADWFGASFDDYSGSFWNAAAGINFTPFQHLGVSLTYNYLALDVDVDKTDWRGKADVRISGPFLALSTYW